MIRFDRVFKRYPNGREALAELSFELEAGEMAFLTGHSGAGKSTVLRLIALLERPTRGQVFVKAGAFDDPSWIEPQLVCWQSRELPWARIPKDLPGVPRNP